MDLLDSVKEFEKDLRWLDDHLVQRKVHCSDLM